MLKQKDQSTLRAVRQIAATYYLRISLFCQDETENGRKKSIWGNGDFVTIVNKC